MNNVIPLPAPTIADVNITTDGQGRFNLNALHKASATDNHKRPSKWLSTQTAKGLISELEAQSPNSGLAPISSIKGGETPGTFAHELLAISYAGWVSPSFQLKVNQVFFDYKTGSIKRPTLPDFTNPAIAARAWADEVDKNIALTEQNAALATDSAALKRLAGADGTHSLTEAAKLLKLRPKDFIAWLNGHGWIYKRAGSATWLGYSSKTDNAYLWHKETTVTRVDGTEKNIVQVRITGKGMARLAKLFEVQGEVA